MPPLSVAHVICGLDMENKYICNVAHVISIMENSLIYEKNERIFLLPSSLPCIYFYWVHWASGNVFDKFWCDAFISLFGLFLFYSISFIFQTALYFAKFNAYFGPASYFWPNLLHILIATYFAEAGLNSAGFGSHDSRSEVRDGVQPFMGSPIFPHNLFDWKYDSRILTSNLHVYM